MDNRIQKLQNYLDTYLGKTDTEIMNKLGMPVEEYFEDTLIYVEAYKIFFRDEIVFFIKEGKVTDIAITECFLWIGLRNIFYYKNEIRKFKIITVKRNFLLRI